jgi:hypothetical protein
MEPGDRCIIERIGDDAKENNFVVIGKIKKCNECTKHNCPPGKCKNRNNEKDVDEDTLHGGSYCF